MPRTQPLPERERGICSRLRIWRESFNLSRADLAKLIGTDNNTLTAIELGRVPLRYGIAYNLVSSCIISPTWLATGAGGMQEYMIGVISPALLGVSPRTLFSQVFDSHLRSYIEKKKAELEVEYFTFSPDEEGQRKAADVLQRLVDAWLRRVSPETYAAFVLAIKSAAEQFIEQPEAQKKSLLNVPTSEQLATQHSVITLSQLIEQVRVIASQRGKASELAAFLDVSRSRVSEWLDTEKGSEPNGDAALRILHWVQLEQAKQKSPGTVTAAPEQQTRRRTSNNENQSGRQDKYQKARRTKRKN